MCVVKGHPTSCCCPKNKEKSFDPRKPVQTRDGRKARIICTDALGSFPIKALIYYNKDSKEESVFHYSPDGMSMGNNVEGPFDLVNVPEREVRFANLYILNKPNLKTSTSLCLTGEECDKVGFMDRKIGQIKISYEDGLPVSVELV